jgi:hypothetical protein
MSLHRPATWQPMQHPTPVPAPGAWPCICWLQPTRLRTLQGHLLWILMLLGWASQVSQAGPGSAAAAAVAAVGSPTSSCQAFAAAAAAAAAAASWVHQVQESGALAAGLVVWV